MSRTLLLSAQGLAWSVGGRTILAPLELDLRRGDSLAVLGPNGAGKTSLLRLLAGVLRPTAGAVVWAGRRHGEISRRELARRVAYVPQVRPLRIPLTVEQLVLLGRYPHLSPWQLSPAVADLRAVEASLALVGLEPLRDRDLPSLSGGERQAAFIAAALAQEAELLILDEPTAHLDARHQREICALLLRLRRERELTLLVATHDLQLAGLLADEALALDGGRVVARGAVAEILEPVTLGRLFQAPFRRFEHEGGAWVVLDYGRQG